MNFKYVILQSPYSKHKSSIINFISVVEKETQKG